MSHDVAENEGQTEPDPNSHEAMLAAMNASDDTEAQRILNARNATRDAAPTPPTLRDANVDDGVETDAHKFF